MRRLIPFLVLVAAGCASAEPVSTTTVPTPPPTTTVAPVSTAVPTPTSTTTTTLPDPVADALAASVFSRPSDEPVILGGEGWRTGYAAVPHLTVLDGTWHLHFAGAAGSLSLLGHATSTDGITWTGDEEPILDPDGTKMGWMVVAPWEGEWRMFWVDGFSPPYRKVYAATAPSPAGPWDELGRVDLVPDREWDTFIVPTGLSNIDGVLWFTYAAYPQLERIPTVGLMTSVDGGETWEPREAPLHSPTPGWWDEKGVVPANVIQTNRGLELFYLGFTETPKVGYQKDSIPMGLLVSTDGGVTWMAENGGLPVLDTGEKGWPGVSTTWQDGTYYVYFGDDLGGRGISLITGG